MNSINITPGETIFVGVAWPYANGSLHAGHLAGCYLPADIFARFCRLRGAEVLCVSGSDCHGTPITLRAEQEGRTPSEVANHYHQEFLTYWERLEISFDLFTTTMTDVHRRVVQDEFLLVLERHFLFQKSVMGTYDEALGKFLPDRYVVGTCPHCASLQARGDQCDDCGRPLDPDMLVEPRSKLSGNAVTKKETIHFYLDLPKLEKALASWVSTHSHWRRQVMGETQKFIQEGLESRAITRDLDWGIPIPMEGFDDKRIYVWFEAVTGYLSASIDWAERNGQPDAWSKWWNSAQARQYYFLGKDNIPFHTIIWPAILMARGDLKQLPYDVPANGFLTFGGKKASKSEGIGYTLSWLLDKYQPDAIRYYIASILPESSDSVFDIADFHRSIDEELVSTWGNLVNRVLSLVQTKCGGRVPEGHVRGDVEEEVAAVFAAVETSFSNIEIRQALRRIFQTCRFANALLDELAPWDKSRSQAEIDFALHNGVFLIDNLSTLLAPILPASSRQIGAYLGYTELDGNPRQWEVSSVPVNRTLQKPAPLFTKLGPWVDENAGDAV